MKSITTLIFLISINFSFSQKHTPYNKDFYFRLITENTRLKEIDSLRALLIDFGSGSTSDFEYTIRNNPQLNEIQLYHPTQAQIDLLSSIQLPKLRYLFIKGYDGIQLNIHAFPSLEHFSIESITLKNLNMENSAMDSLNILDIKALNLNEWKTAPIYLKLSLIELNAPQLKTLPFQQLPMLFQFSAHCSFDEFPIFLCDCKEFEHISFTNYKVIRVPKCLLRQLKKRGYYSNISLYDGIDGKLVKAYFSPDRKK